MRRLSLLIISCSLCALALGRPPVDWPELPDTTIDRDLTGCKYRYWFDRADAKAVTGTLTGNVQHFDLPIDTLDDWFHTIHLQVQDKSGNWSETVTRHFVIMSQLTDSIDRDLTGGKIRYWFDKGSNVARMEAISGNIQHLDLPVDTLDDWFHTIHLQVEDKSGNWSETVTRHFVLIPEYKHGIQRYEYWMNDNWEERHIVEVANGQMPMHLQENLPVETQPIRSHKFHFAIEDDKPVVHPKNELHIVFFDEANRYATAAETYIDDLVGEEVTDASTLSPGLNQAQKKLDSNEIKWYSMQLTAGDSLAFQTSRESMMNLFSPTGKEVYAASDSTSTEYGGIRATENGTYYFALHDVSTGVGNLLLNYQLLDHIDVNVMMGDVNGDSLVNVADVVMTVNHILRRQPAGFNALAADFGSDGEIDVSDLVEIVRIITGERESSPNHLPAKSLINDDYLTGFIDGKKLSLCLNNETDYTAMQMSVSLPSGTRVSDVRISGDRTDGHTVGYQQTTDGQLIVLAYSGSNRLLKGKDGVLLEIKTESGITNATIDDIVLVTPRKGSRRFEGFSIDIATGLHSLDGGSHNAPLYDLSGRRVKGTPTSGIYIRNGQKIRIR